MSVIDTNVIDMIGTTSEGVVTLTISDHLDWDEIEEHLLSLQQKINTYIEFIESGNVYDILPLSKDKPKAIRVYFKYLPKDEKVINVLDNVSEILLKSNSMIRFECLPFES